MGLDYFWPLIIYCKSYSIIKIWHNTVISLKVWDEVLRIDYWRGIRKKRRATAQNAVVGPSSHTYSKSRRAFFAHALEYVGLKIRNGRGIAKPRLERAWKTIGGRGRGGSERGGNKVKRGGWRGYSLFPHFYSGQDIKSMIRKAICKRNLLIRIYRVFC